MDFKRFDQAYVLRLEQGEEIVAALRRFCQEQGITGGWVMGIGTVRQAILSYYVLPEGTLEKPNTLTPANGFSPSRLFVRRFSLTPTFPG